MMFQVNFKLGPLPRGDEDVCLLGTELLPGNNRYHILDILGVSEIEMIEIHIDFTSEFSTTDNNLHTIEDTRKI